MWLADAVRLAALCACSDIQDLYRGWRSLEFIFLARELATTNADTIVREEARHESSLRMEAVAHDLRSTIHSMLAVHGF